MYGRPATIFYSLSAFALAMALFAVQPSSSQEVHTLQTSVRQNLAVALQQVIGDQPVFDELELVYDSVTEFYEQSAIAALDLVRNEQADRDLAFVFANTWGQIKTAFSEEKTVLAHGPLEIPAEKFMTEEPLYNIIPAKAGGAVAGTAISFNSPWVTLEDDLTGQLYCVAIYNGEVNKYLGPCVSDYY